MNAILGGFSFHPTRVSRAFAAAGLIAGLARRHAAAARTEVTLAALGPHLRRDVLGDPDPSTIGPRVDADPHAVRMLMHVGR